MTQLGSVRPHDPPTAADRPLVVISDIEMGAGGPSDDFPHSEWLGQLIRSYNAPPLDRLGVDLVFNGDTFDLHKTSYLGMHPRHITAEVAVGKMVRIVGAHPEFFAAVRDFLDHEDAPRRVFFVVGNHDPELLYPDVQLLIQTKLGRFDGVEFPGFSVEIGRVYLEHGCQLDPMFAMEPERPFLDYRGQQILNLSWGSVALLDTVLALQPLLSFHERLMPRRQAFELLPEVKELITGAFWKYYTRDYWKGYFSHPDPTKKMSWSMVKQLVWRFSTKNTDVSIDDRLQQRLRQDDRIRLYVLGHTHKPGWWSHGDRKILQSGCMRNEYMIVDGGRAVRPMPKSYIEAYVDEEGSPIRSHFVELMGPP
ncbi:MAG: metallophosphoesterase, partial [Deltaproteobacteria bacterium]|nr:metallophosphoesterase [Deltaproteobacteria bacterium]